MKSSHPFLLALLSSCSLVACIGEADVPPTDDTPLAPSVEAPPAEPPAASSPPPPAPLPPPVSLTRNVDDPPSARCGVGADRVETGLDLDRDGVLDPAEVTQTTTTCKKRTTARRMFLSSAKYDGNLGGVAGADAKCQALANAVPALSNGIFLAWLSSSTSSPATTFSDDAPLGFVRVDGVKIADGLADLLDGQLHVAPNVTEQGLVVSSTGPTDYAWSDTTSLGLSAKIGSCNDWTSSNGLGLLGTPRVGHSPWAGYTPIATSIVSGCAESVHLYCFEQ